MKPHEFPPLTDILDNGIQSVIDDEQDEQALGGGKRYPLSPSQSGACSLKLARDVAVYHKVAEFPQKEKITPRLRRIFDRGKTIECALVESFAKYTNLNIELSQQRVFLFPVKFRDLQVDIEGDIDGLCVTKERDFKLLLDFKSKGAYFTGGSDSVQKFFDDLSANSYVERIGSEKSNAYFITDVVNFLDTCDPDDFFYGYILQLNLYALSDWFRRTRVDAVSLFFENKNNSNHYEVRWVPNEALFNRVKDKFQSIFEAVFTGGCESVGKDFNLGSTRCRLCEYHQLCYGERPQPRDKIQAGEVGLQELFDQFVLGEQATNTNGLVAEKILTVMENKNLGKVELSNGLVYERKFLKTPKPHYELRRSK